VVMFSNKGAVDSAGVDQVARDKAAIVAQEITLGVGTPDTRLGTLQATIGTGNAVLMTDDAQRSGALVLPGGTSLKASRRKKYTNTSGSTTPGDVSVTGSNVEIENVEVIGNVTTQSVFFSKDISNVRFNKVKLAALGHGIHIANPGITGATFENMEINARKYGLLVGAIARNSKGFRILNNDIYADRDDAIELNSPTTPIGEEYDGLREVFIMGNRLASTSETETVINSGFALGIANAREVIAIGNMSLKSRQEALHIEDDQENVVIVGNIFKGCVKGGARLLHNGGAGLPRMPIVTNNFFVKKAGAEKTEDGIRRVYDETGAILANVSNNYVKGFDKGIVADGGSTPMYVEGCVVEDCNVAVKAGASVKVVGTVMAINTPNLAEGASSAIIDAVISDITPTSILKYTGVAGSTGATLKKFAAKTAATPVAGNTAKAIDLFPLPTAMQGRLTIRGGSGADNVMVVADVTYSGGVVTNTNLLVHRQGTRFQNTAIEFVINSGQLAMKLTSTATLTLNFRYDFEGTYYQA